MDVFLWNGESIKAMCGLNVLAHCKAGDVVYADTHRVEALEAAFDEMEQLEVLSAFRKKMKGKLHCT